MKYLAFVMRAVIALIGLYMMYSFPDIAKPPFVSGLAIFLIAVYLELHGYFGAKFSECLCKKPKKK